jgi:hypothetical protein
MANPRTLPQDKSNPLTNVHDSIIDSSTPGKFSVKNYVNGSTMDADSDGKGAWNRMSTTSPEGDNCDIVRGVNNQASTGSTLTTGHNDEFNNGGKKENSKGGSSQENGGPSSVATDGSQITAASASQKNLSTDGNGKHFMKGEQTFTVDEGGIDYEVSNRFMVHAKGSTVLTSEENVLVKGQNCPVQIIADQNVGIRSEGQDTYIQAAGKIYLQVLNSSTQIVLDQNSIKFTASSIEFIKA